VISYQCKIIPASNVGSGSTELDNITAWSRANNLTLNRSKSVEIVFTDKWRRQKISPPPVLPDIERVTEDSGRHVHRSTLDV